MIGRLSLLAVLTLVAALAARADEFTLKDGSKIDGTIVGFQGNSFRVKTSYGFAIVRKDQIASIRITDAARAAEAVPAKKLVAPATSDTSRKAPARASVAPSSTTSSQAVKSASIASAPKTIARNAPTTSASAAPPAAFPAPGHSPAAAGARSSPNAAGPAPPSVPPIIHEQVTGNTYVNQTYGFSMYRPPDWELIEGARSLLPGAITAMGTGDQTTYLLIGQDAAGRSIENQMAATVNRLAGIMDNFQPLAETRLNISGAPAIERRFHGSVDQHDWSGVVVLIPRGPLVFTIFGMTYAETDLVQIQENVIARAISSIHFAR
jgi:hypothetical protein